MEMLGYLPADTSEMNPSGLPIGFTITTSEYYKDAFVGLTCAACHTNQIDYKNQSLLIEGAPTLANFTLFFERLVDAVINTHDDAAKFDRFAKKVLHKNYSDSTSTDLKTKLAALFI